jgi:HEAT repeat protein
MLMTADRLLGDHYSAIIKDETLDAYSRAVAIREFRNIELLDEAHAGPLVDALYDQDREVRNEAAKTLIWHADSRPDVVVLSLVSKLDDESEANSPSAFVLQRIGTKGLPVFLSMLDDVDASQRLLGARLIGKLGPSAESAAQKLRELAGGDLDEDVRGAASQALAAVSQGRKQDIVLSSPSTTVSNYLIASENKAQWMRIRTESTWSAGFTFGTFPATLPTSSLRISMYDDQKSEIQTIFVADAFVRQKPGLYYLKMYRQGEGEEVVVPFKIDILENR